MSKVQKKLAASKSEKKIESQKLLLQRTFQNIELYKSYRFQIPATICIAIFTLSTIAIKDPKSLTFALECIYVTSFFIISAIGTYALFQVRMSYNYLADQIYYLYDQLKIYGPDFYPPNMDHTNPRQRVNHIFTLGFISIWLSFSMTTFLVIYSS